MIEQNIWGFCDIIANKLFYYVGNSGNRTLIYINCDGTGRKEWPLYISEVLFEQGGWLYFTRKSGHNSILCELRLDGSKFSIIVRDIEKFEDIKNGYLYYINDESTLVKVRMDGSNSQELCEDVFSVLSGRKIRLFSWRLTIESNRRNLDNQVKQYNLFMQLIFLEVESLN